MTPALILSLIGGSGIGAVLASIVAAVFGRKRMSAEATEIITRAASGVVANLERDNEELRERLDAREESDENLRAVLQLHAAWDALVWVRLTSLGITDLPEPPPLRVPPVKRRNT